MTSAPARAAWLHSARFDLLFVLAPPIVASVAVVLASPWADGTSETPWWVWFTFLLCIDVGHVYTTLFRTYFDRRELAENRFLLIAAPMACWCGLTACYWIDPRLFGSVLTYLAVFHFIRQQYGFLRLYSARERCPRLFRDIDAAVIYAATLYPLVYWHSRLPLRFGWFTKGDFMPGLPPVAERTAFVVYLLLISAYVVKECYLILYRRERFNVAKGLLVLGTLLSWYVGIVRYNGIVAFTITCTVAHGIPYAALVWTYGKKGQLAGGLFKPGRAAVGVTVFVGMALALAYLDQGLFAGLISRDHVADAFRTFAWLPRITTPAVLLWTLPLLSLPSVVHYVLDGFIWRLRDDRATWRKTLFDE